MFLGKIGINFKHVCLLSTLVLLASVPCKSVFADVNDVTIIDEILEIQDVEDDEEAPKINDFTPVLTPFIDVAKEASKNSAEVQSTLSAGPIAEETGNTNMGPGMFLGSNISGEGKDLRFGFSKETLARNADKRNALVAKAMTFLGGRYVYGGSSPATGFDCSGFCQYLYREVLNINLNRNSAAQSLQGKVVDYSQIQKGDLLFYSSNGKVINHVGMYIGDGKIIHASSTKEGIKISNWNYRNPVVIKNYID